MRKFFKHAAVAIGMAVTTIAALTMVGGGYWLGFHLMNQPDLLKIYVGAALNLYITIQLAYIGWSAFTTDWR